MALSQEKSPGSTGGGKDKKLLKHFNNKKVTL